MKKFLVVVLFLSTVLLPVPFLFAQDFGDVALDESSVLAPVEEVSQLAYNYISYPAVAQKAGVAGRVKVRYSVKPSGQITNLQAEYLQPDTELDAVIEKVIVVGQAPLEPDVSLEDRGLLTLQAQSLITLQQIRQLQPREIDGQKVLTSREVVFEFILE